MALSIGVISSSDGQQPGPPTIGAASAINFAAASVSFTPPAYAGKSSTSLTYTVTSSPGGFTATGSASPITVSGLTGGTTYTFTVTAKNSTATSLPSASSNAITAIAPPFFPPFFPPYFPPYFPPFFPPFFPPYFYG